MNHEQHSLQRDVDVPITPLFVERTSPRAFTTETITDNDLRGILEAARWAPSSFNEQPWRYHVTTGTDTSTRRAWNEAVMEGNRWSDDAPVLIFVTCKTTFARNGKPNRHAHYDTGAATLQLVLEAHARGISAHQMGGIHVDKVREILNLPDDEEVICGLVLGYAPQLDKAPSGRKPRDDVVTIH